MEEAQSIVSASGNNFHRRVVNSLREKGWYTTVSPYYMDSGTSKAREIDLIAEKSWDFDDGFKSTHGTINFKLFIECKYIPNVNVLWFDERDSFSAKKWIAENTPLPKGSYTEDGHHYLSSCHKVAKLFASKNMPNIENEVIYRALNQSLNAMVCLRHGETIIPKEKHKRRKILTTVEMPGIFCNSFNKLYRVDMNGDSNPEKIDKNFQLEVNYAYISPRGDKKNEYFLVDVVDFENIQEFLSVLDLDHQTIANALEY